MEGMGLQRVIKLRVLKSTLVLGIGGVAFPLECREFFPASFANAFDEARIRVTDEVLEGRVFPIFIAHEEQWYEWRKQHHSSCQLDRLQGHELAQPFTHH